MPAGEFGCAKSSPVGRTATSKRALEMSTPTNTASPPLAAVEHPPAPPYLADPSSGSINHSGSTGGTQHGDPRSPAVFQDHETIDLPCWVPPRIYKGNMAGRSAP